MESRARFLGHSIHQSLVAFPVGLLATAVILDLIAIFGRHSSAVIAAYSTDDMPLCDEPPAASVRR